MLASSADIMSLRRQIERDGQTRTIRFLHRRNHGGKTLVSPAIVRRSMQAGMKTVTTQLSLLSRKNPPFGQSFTNRYHLKLDKRVR